MAQDERRNGASRKGGLNPLYVILGVIALGGAGWIAFAATSGGGEPVTKPILVPELQNDSALIAMARGVRVGPETALPVRVFSDFTCPSCKHFAEQVEPHLKQEFVETGKVQFIYHDLPLDTIGAHRHGFIAARAARCANEQDQFWTFHDYLFARQGAWFHLDPPTERFEWYAEGIGMDVGAFRECVNSDRYADVVTANGVLARSLGVRGTPTVFVGTVRVGNQWSDWSALRAIIQQQLGGS